MKNEDETPRKLLWETVETDERLKSSRPVTADDRREANAALWEVTHNAPPSDKGTGNT